MNLPALFEAARALGTVKAVVRNPYAVMERTGTVEHAGSDGTILRVQGSNFQLALDASRLANPFALVEERAGGTKRSIVLPDRSGAPAAKLVLRESSDRSAFERLRARLENRYQAPVSSRGAWRRHPACGVEAGDALPVFLYCAAAHGLPLELTVRNHSASLAAETAVRHVKRSERAPWINVLERTLHLHLFEREIAAPVLEGRLEGFVLHWFAADGTKAFSAGAGAQYHGVLGFPKEKER